MGTNKTAPTSESVESFLKSIREDRREEARVLIAMMQEIAHEKPYVWRPSIIGFGKQQYAYDTGRTGDMPRIAFSPRKASITFYFSEGFDRYTQELEALGKYKQSVSCLYVSRLTDIDFDILRKMLERSFSLAGAPRSKPATVDEYVASIPKAARPAFDELRRLVHETLPYSREVMSYGIVGYKIDEKRARVYISGWKDHVAMYPLPKEEVLLVELKPYIKGKGTAWFALDQPLPKKLIKSTVSALCELSHKT